MDQSPSSEHDLFALETYDFAAAPPFVALSYTWGSSEPTHDIIVDESLLSIRENLHVALKVLRSLVPNQTSLLDEQWRWEDREMTSLKNLLQENGYPLMWIDALCINQSDNLEKNHQVNMMGRIFSTAERVISWLGDEADNSDCVMKAIQTALRTHKYGFEVIQAMDAFVKRPYWRRMWVIQEFVLAQDLIILCGRQGARWEDLVHFWHDEKFVIGTGGDCRFFSGKSVQSVGKDGLAALIFERSARRGGHFLHTQNTNELISVDNIMTRFTYGECSDPRDQIYALLALIEPQAGVEPLPADYTISTEDLYHRVLGYIGPLKYGGEARKKLREALDSSSWASTEAAKLHEAVYHIIGMENSFYQERMISDRADLIFCNKVQEYLSKHLDQPVDYCWDYHVTISRFRTFPRDRDRATWRRFRRLLRRFPEKRREAPLQSFNKTPGWVEVMSSGGMWTSSTSLLQNTPMGLYFTAVTWHTQ